VVPDAARAFFRGRPLAVRHSHHRGRCSIRAKTARWGMAVLQSGTSIGAIVTPLIMRGLMTSETRELARSVFKQSARAGLVWLVLWFVLLRGGGSSNAGISRARETADGSGAGFVGDDFQPPDAGRLFSPIASINTTWQIMARLAAEDFAGRSPAMRNRIRCGSPPRGIWRPMSACIGAGLLAVLARAAALRAIPRGWWFFVACGALCAMGALTAVFLDRGWVLLAVLLLAGGGRALGVFPRSITRSHRDISARHQGRITGFRGCRRLGAGRHRRRSCSAHSRTARIRSTSGSCLHPACRCSPRLPLVVVLGEKRASGGANEVKSVTGYGGSHLLHTNHPPPYASPIPGPAAHFFAPTAATPRWPALTTCGNPAVSAKKKIALIGTVVRKHSSRAAFPRPPRARLHVGWGMASAAARSCGALYRSISRRWTSRAVARNATISRSYPEDRGCAHARHGEARRWTGW